MFRQNNSLLIAKLRSHQVTSEEFENRGLTLKAHRSWMFSVHTRREKFENQTIISHFDLCLRKTRSGKRVPIVFGKFRFRSVMCPPENENPKAGVFKFFRFEERFLNAPFSWRIIVDGGPNRRNKVQFSIFSGINFTNCPACQIIFVKTLTPLAIVVSVRFFSIFYRYSCWGNMNRSVELLCTLSLENNTKNHKQNRNFKTYPKICKTNFLSFSHQPANRQPDNFSFWMSFQNIKSYFRVMRRKPTSSD